MYYHMILFGEFIASNNFFRLLSWSFHLANGASELGLYLQGIPVRNVVDFVWGTNSGIRTMPLLSFFSLLQWLFGIHWDIVYGCIAILAPFVGFVLALRLLHKKWLFIILAGTFYAANAWIINRFFSGFWQLNLVYSFLPLLIVIPLKIPTIQKHTVKYWAIFYALIITIVIIAQPYFLLFPLFFSFCQFVLALYHKQKEQIQNLSLLYLYSIALLVIYNAYLLLPSILAPEYMYTAPGQYFSLQSLISNGRSVQFIDVLQLVHVGTNTIAGLLGYIPLFAILIMFFFQKQKQWIFFCGIVVFIFLSKGANEPFSEVSKFLYMHIFILHFFRDPSRLIAGIVLFASFILASFETKRKWLAVGTFCFLFCVIGFIAVNMVTAKSGTIVELSVPKEYYDLQTYVQKNLQNDTSHRLLTLPNDAGIKAYTWNKGKLPASANTIFASVIPLAIPVADSSYYPDSYANQVSAYLYQKYLDTFDANYLHPLGVKYILVDRSIRSIEEQTIKSKEEFIKKGYKVIFSEGSLTLYTVPFSASIYTTNKPLFAIGDLHTVASLSNTNRPVVLLNQDVNARNLQSNILQGNDILADGSNKIPSLASESLARQYALDLFGHIDDTNSPFVSYEPYKISFIRSYGLLYTSGRSVLAQHKGSIRITKSFPAGSYTLLLKGLTFGNGASLGIRIGSKDYTYDIHDTNLDWSNLGNITLSVAQDHIDILKPDKSYLQIDYLDLIPTTIFNEQNVQIQQIVSTMHPITDVSVVADTHVGVSISPTQMSLSSKQTYLTYDFTYGKNWISDAPSNVFIGNGYGMTFIAHLAKIQKIYYPPQILYILSIILSLVGLGTTLVVGIYYTLRRYRKSHID